MAISEEELSDNEGPPSFVPIIPSLNKKWVKDAPRSDGDHLKCNTFAELQERLDCIDGSEGTATLGAEDKLAPLRTQTRVVNPNPDQIPSQTTKCDDEQYKLQSAISLMDSNKWTSADGKRVLVYPFQPGMLKTGVRFSQDSEPVVREKVYLKEGVPKPSASPCLPITSRAELQLGEADGRTSPVGMCQQALKQGQSPGFSREEKELNIRASLLGRCLNRDFLRTTITLQQLVELTGEDELVFTVVEELIPDNGHPSNLAQSFHNTCTLQGLTSGSRPVSIISSINDEYDAYTSQQGAMGHVANGGQELFLRCGNEQLSADSREITHSSFKETVEVCESAQIPHQTYHSSLSRKSKPTSSTAEGCSRLEGKQEEFVLQRSSNFASRYNKLPSYSASKPSSSDMTSISCNRRRGNSNSVPRPSKILHLTQRVVDGCEKSSCRKGDTLNKLPRLTRGATTLGTVSVPQSSDFNEAHEGALATDTRRSGSLGKKSVGQKSNTISKSRPGNISPKPSQEDRKMTVLSSSALNSIPKIFTSEEEFNIRHRAGSLSHRTSSLKTEHCSAKISSSLKTQGAKADSSRCYGSLLSLDRSQSQVLAGCKPELFKENNGAALGGNNRSLPRFGFPPSVSTSSSSQISPGVFGTSNQLADCKVSTSNSKSLSSSSKSPHIASVHNANLPLAGKNSACSGTGAKVGRGTIMGTKQVISRAANSRISELAAESRGKQFSRTHGNNDTDSGTSSVSGSPISTPLPSPYSKVTAPRRPQRYSSGHGSDNSSILSGELPPAMGRTALFYHSGSSGYESMIRDSETTGSTSSAHDSMSESGVSTSNRSRVSKSPKKRGNGKSMVKRPINFIYPLRAVMRYQLFLQCVV